MPKGIDKKNWDTVHQLACDIVNADMMDDEVLSASKTTALLTLLYELKQKYHNHPSILATIGDYLDDHDERNSYYKMALEIARTQGDKVEEAEIIDSMKHLDEEYN